MNRNRQSHREPDYLTEYDFKNYEYQQLMENTRIRDSITKINTELDMLKKLVLRGEIDDLKQDIIIKNSRLEEDNDKHTKKVYEFHKKINELNNKINELNKKIEKKENKFDELDKRHKELHLKYSDLLRNRDYIEEELKEMKNKYENSDSDSE